jgi:hypothetical protein
VDEEEEEEEDPVASAVASVEGILLKSSKGWPSAIIGGSMCTSSIAINKSCSFKLI